MSTATAPAIDKAALMALAKSIAAQHLIEPALWCAVLEQESNWKPYAYRYEPAFQMHYVAPLNLDPMETYARSCSYGLCQIMGQVARELGFTGDLNGLFDPHTNLEYGIRHFANKMQHAKGDVRKCLLLWNGGSRPEYVDEVLQRMEKYR